MSAPVNSTPIYSRSASASSASSTGSEPRRNSSFLATVGHKIAQHHREVQNAYEAYYSMGARPQSARPSATPQPSADSQRRLTLEEALATKQQSKASKAWASMKKHAKEHHESVNASYRTLYGGH